jgi:hypothetical protein
MESVESQNQASPSFHSSLGISPTAGEIPTFPPLRLLRGGKVENQKQVSHFPTRVLSSCKPEKIGRALPTARRGGASRLADQSTWNSKADRSRVNKTGQLDMLTTVCELSLSTQSENFRFSAK